MSGRECYQFRARDRVLPLGGKTRIMGIINVTPDSFSGDGQVRGKTFLASALRLSRRMRGFGADILDIGGESTRPGARAVSASEQCRRVVPLVEALLSSGDNGMISVDTSSFTVAKEAIKAGAHIINVVQSNVLSPGLLKLVRDHQAGIVLMHMRGTPRTMKSHTHYRDLVSEVLAELTGSVHLALNSGIDRECLIVDPGIGFAKTAEQNFLLLKELQRFAVLRLPILVGPSRKSFIGALLGVDPSKRLAGTIAASVASAMNGGHILRVHDVRDVRMALTITDAITTGGK